MVVSCGRLNVAAWLFYLPQLVLAEVCMWWWWRRVNTQPAAADKPTPPTPHRRDSLGHSPRSHSPPLSHDPDSQQLDSSRRTTPGAAAPSSPATSSPVAAVVTIATSPDTGAGADAGDGAVMVPVPHQASHPTQQLLGILVPALTQQPQHRRRLKQRRGTRPCNRLLAGCWALVEGDQR